MKKIFTILIFLITTSCGFKPLLKDLDYSKLIIKKINYSGKNNLTYLLKNNLNLAETLSTDGFMIYLSITENISLAAKNTSGITTYENLIISINIVVKDEKEKNTLINDNFSQTRRLQVTNNLSADETLRNYERIQLIQILSQQIKSRLIFLVK